MAKLAERAISTHDKLKAGRRGPVAEVQEHLPILLSRRALQPLSPHDLLLGYRSKKDLAELRTVNLRGVAALAPGEDMLALTVVEAVDSSVSFAGIVLEHVKDARFLHNSLAAAGVKVKAAAPRWLALGSALINDVVRDALGLEEGRKRETRWAGTDDSYLWGHDVLIGDQN